MQYVRELKKGENRYNIEDVTKKLKKIFANMLTPDGEALTACKKILKEGPNGETANYKNAFPILSQFYLTADDYDVDWDRLVKMSLQFRDANDNNYTAFINALETTFYEMNETLGENKFVKQTRQDLLLD